MNKAVQLRQRSASELPSFTGGIRQGGCCLPGHRRQRRQLFQLHVHSQGRDNTIARRRSVCSRASHKARWDKPHPGSTTRRAASASKNRPYQPAMRAHAAGVPGTYPKESVWRSHLAREGDGGLVRAQVAVASRQAAVRREGRRRHQPWPEPVCRGVQQSQS